MRIKNKRYLPIYYLQADFQGGEKPKEEPLEIEIFFVGWG